MLQASCANRLLASLPAADFDRIAPFLQPIDLPLRFVLAGPETPVEHLYFPTSGIASIIAASPDGHMTDVGMFGREGVGSVSALLDSDASPTRVVMQIAGDGYRLPLAAMRSAMDESASLRRLMLRFAHVMSLQTAYTALCNAVHTLDERLARWLLMCADRHPDIALPLTHDVLSGMLGVRRPSITTALHVLEGRLFIRSRRGQVIIRDRQALERFACNAYGPPEAEYARLIAPAVDLARP
jgi:CRP-like cAMP-binding protein